MQTTKLPFHENEVNGLVNPAATSYCARSAAHRRRRHTFATLALLLPAALAAQTAAQPSSVSDQSEEGAFQTVLVYTGDVIRNTTGGIAVGSAYLNNLDLEVAIDGERAFGMDGLTLFLHGLHNNDARFSPRYSGDALAEVRELTALGVDGMFGDCPDQLLQALGRQR